MEEPLSFNDVTDYDNLAYFVLFVERYNTDKIVDYVTLSQVKIALHVVKIT